VSTDIEREAMPYAAAAQNWVAVQYNQGASLDIMLSALLMTAAWLVVTRAVHFEDRSVTEEDSAGAVAMFEKALGATILGNDAGITLGPMHAA